MGEKVKLNIRQVRNIQFSVQILVLWDFTKLAFSGKKITSFITMDVPLVSDNSKDFEN